MFDPSIEPQFSEMIISPIFGVFNTLLMAESLLLCCALNLGDMSTLTSFYDYRLRPYAFIYHDAVIMFPRQIDEKKTPLTERLFHGAARQIRTADLILTKVVNIM